MNQQIIDQLTELTDQLTYKAKEGDVNKPEVKEYFTLGKVIDKLKKHKEARNKALKVRVGTNSVIDNISGYEVTVKSSERTSLESKKVKELYPDVFAECSKTTPVETLTVKESI